MAKTKKYEFAPAANPVVTESFCGTDAGFYISRAMYQAVSLDCLKVIENVKFKTHVQQMEYRSILADATCDFANVGELNMGERILTPKNLQVNLQLCKLNLLSSWEALQMRAGAWNNGDVPSFTDYAVSLMAKQIGMGVEISIWQGDDANPGSFTGFTTPATGTFANDPSVVVGAATVPFTAGNIIANIEGAIALIPTAVLGSEDLRIFMNQKTYQMYIAAVSTLGYLNAYNMQGDYVPVVNGIKVCVTNGMLDDQLVIADMTNLFFGTDLVSDTTEVRLLDMTDLDGSNNIRMVAKYTGGVQHGVGGDIVWWK
tara:strand:+ start:3342 stop:4283 length:942 start_codon:yes stop_codon:yes gene_type:complete